MAEISNFYQILGLVNRQDDSTITPEQLRQAYKQALLHHHPDKQVASRTKTHPQAPTVDEISKAYTTLSDPDTRSQYDRKLRLDGTCGRADAATRHTGMETVDLEELNFDEVSGTWIRECRCGSKPAYVITEAELEKTADFGELITGCKGCSLWLKVLFTVEE
ncbi:hypothetical protein M409DRAFT_52803 [Zasmidium cellare ATCC 36951]|uniref:Diphthamide biosynthesis protein 4 n=1 Tax=Zasmidium cellare ATCC 36951 TaxID=1080233 RepID=A0A6A6CP05_ZASCE|nr:uncharacterized protein M409DRAFT_52803 [Zasmidium cellare ATCC 36951]KAF2168791.1 hypothetical protein M409DRAFT_52803 [Zasmidium cellare ATCC 36951]